MTKKKRSLNIDQVLDVCSAFELVAQNDVLPAEINYWLAKLVNQVRVRHKAFMAAREPERLRISRLQEALMREAKAGWQMAVQNLDTEFTLFVEKLKVDITGKEKADNIDVRTFKRSDFIAKADIKRIRHGQDGKSSTIEIKEGDDLVPPQFYMLMGDLIEE